MYIWRKSNKNKLMQELKNKVAYITGASKGIGLAIAKAFVDAGMRVAISSRKEGDIHAAAASISTEDNKVLPIVSDVSDYAAEKKALQLVHDTFGAVDVVIANAGVGHFAPIDELSCEDWHQMIDTNLTGAFHTLKASVDDLKKTKGYYITIASLAGTNFFEKAAGYNASKFGVVGFTQATMLDLRKYGIKVSTIMPGSVSTHFNGHTPSTKDAWKIQPEDIATIVIQLLQMNPRVLPSKIEVRPTLPGGKA